MRLQPASFLIAGVVALCIGFGEAASAQSATGRSPAPAASASPSPAPLQKTSPFSYSIDSFTSAVNQQFVGPGTTPVYGPNFRANPPTTPYDMFSGSTNTTGQGIDFDLLLTPKYVFGNTLAVTVTLGYGSIGGSGNAINYWGDPAMPTINANLGSRAYSLTPNFPTHNGQDSISAQRGSVLSGTLESPDGNQALTVGWFDPKLSVPFVFTPAPWYTTPTQLSPVVPGSPGDGAPSVDVLKALPDQLPMQGVGLYGKFQDTSVEALDADLPAPSNAPARIASISAVQNRSDIAVSYSAELLHLSESGPETGPFLFGSAPSLTYGAVGPVPLSTVFGQRMTVLGFGATFPFFTSDAELRYGYSCYGADGAAMNTANCASGNYFYGKLHHGFTSWDLALEAVRFEPEYAPAVLNYGIVENVWQTPFAWPSSFFPGSYQLVDDKDFSPNRQGFRLTATTIVAGLEVRVRYGQFTQIQPFDPTTALTPGFIEPYFLPQVTGGSGALGLQQQWSAWFNYPWKIVNATLDLTDLTINRPAYATNPGDSVAMNYPAYVFTLSRGVGPRFFFAGGVGRSAVYGSYNVNGPINADLSQDVIFAGVQYRQNGNSGYGLQWRMYSTNGSGNYPGTLPAYHGPQFQFYQRLKT